MFNRIGALAVCLLIAATASAQDYRFKAERGRGFACLQKELVQWIVDGVEHALSADEGDPAATLGMRNAGLAQVDEQFSQWRRQRLCTLFSVHDTFEMVGEDEADPEWVQVRQKDRWGRGRVNREMWALREWFEEVPR